MVIIRGKKVVRKNRGVGGHLCPVCCDVTVVRWTERRQVPHLYYIPIGRSTLVNVELRCKKCRTRTALIGEDAELGSPIRDRDARGMDPVELACRSGPLDAESMARLLEREIAARKGTFNAEDRGDRLRASFFGLGYQAEFMHRRGGHQSVTALISALMLGVMLVALFLIWDWQSRRYGGAADTALAFGTAAVALALLGVVVYRVRIAADQSFRRFILRPLARSLAPLRPTAAELDDALHDARDAGLRYPASATGEQIIREIEELSRRS